MTTREDRHLSVMYDLRHALPGITDYDADAGVGGLRFELAPSLILTVDFEVGTRLWTIATVIEGERFTEDVLQLDKPWDVFVPVHVALWKAVDLLLTVYFGRVAPPLTGEQVAQWYDVGGPETARLRMVLSLQQLVARWVSHCAGAGMRDDHGITARELAVLDVCFDLAGEWSDPEVYSEYDRIRMDVLDEGPPDGWEDWKELRNAYGAILGSGVSW